MNITTERAAALRRNDVIMVGGSPALILSVTDAIRSKGDASGVKVHIIAVRQDTKQFCFECRNSDRFTFAEKAAA